MAFGLNAETIGGFAAGGGAGAIIGGMMGGSSGPNFQPIKDAITLRQHQIDEFSNQLESARNNVLANYQNLQKHTMARFSGAFEASLAGRGLSPTGGAFASGVGQKAGELESQYDTLNTNMTEKNLYDVENMRSQLFGSQMGLAEGETMIPYQAGQAKNAFMMNLLGSGAKMAMGAALGPGGAAASSLIDQSGNGVASNGISINGGGMSSVPGMGGYGRRSVFGD